MHDSPGEPGISFQSCTRIQMRFRLRGASQGAVADGCLLGVGQGAPHEGVAFQQGLRAG